MVNAILETKPPCILKDTVFNNEKQADMLYAWE